MMTWAKIQVCQTERAQRAAQLSERAGQLACVREKQRAPAFGVLFHRNRSGGPSDNDTVIGESAARARSRGLARPAP